MKMIFYSTTARSLRIGSERPAGCAFVKDMSQLVHSTETSTAHKKREKRKIFFFDSRPEIVAFKKTRIERKTSQINIK